LKNILDSSSIIKYYKIVYEDGWNKLEQDAQQELIWFTSKGMPVVQKHWTPFQPEAPARLQNTKRWWQHQMKHLYCLLKYYAEIPLLNHIQESDLDLKFPFPLIILQETQRKSKLPQQGQQKIKKKKLFGKKI